MTYNAPPPCEDPRFDSDRPVFTEEEKREHRRRGNKLHKWSDREQLMLYMILAGKKTAEIAESLQMSQRRVQSIRASPLFQQRLRATRNELRTRTIGDFLQQIAAEAVPNFQFFVDMRDDPTLYQDDPRVRIAAARAIQTEVDRVYPRVSKHEEERHVRVTFDAKMLQQMSEALSDDGSKPIPVEYTPVRDEETTISPKALDDYVAELKRREAEAVEDAELE